MRIALGVAYVGSAFAGWQLQAGVSTIQGAVEKALTQVGTHPVRVICAGRTDRGVHAAEQVIHFDTSCNRTEKIWVAACNYYLPADIRILWAKIVPKEFHARFSAISRTYQYLIYEGMMPWMNNRALIYNRYSLDPKAMQQASNLLIGEHDFSAFRSTNCQARSPVRHLNQLTVLRKKPWIRIEVTANAFLHHMVRNIVGVLLDIGRGKYAVAWMADLLHSRNRNHGAMTAAAQGLYLQEVKYPTHFELPKSQEKFILEI